MPNTKNRYLRGTGTLGQYLSSAAPNITGSFDARELTHLSDNISSGALYSGGTSSYGQMANGNTGTSIILKFDASKSSTVYTNTTEIRPNSICINFIIKY